ncbi:LAFE_0H04302g1_1 [Lachancea fermentati]|uniref:LAFE_0H04302g1_1 n=1 Tax=Lachancea fermentati TaxID=4955 RepID=A0A1G4MJG7_LACFM|nr:LAFE_0H04302g1_1 [Lachancea fermentati]
MWALPINEQIEIQKRAVRALEMGGAGGGEARSSQLALRTTSISPRSLFPKEMLHTKHKTESPCTCTCTCLGACSGARSRGSHNAVCWALLSAHLLILLALIRRVAPNALQCGQLCLLLTVIFVFVRHRTTRMFSLFASYAGIIVLAKSALMLARSYVEIARAAGDAADVSVRSMSPATGRLRALQTTLASDEAAVRHELLLHVLLAACFVFAQMANLTLYLAERRRALCDECDTDASGRDLEKLATALPHA